MTDFSGVIIILQFYNSTCKHNIHQSVLFGRGREKRKPGITKISFRYQLIFNAVYHCWRRGNGFKTPKFNKIVIF